MRPVRYSTLRRPAAATRHLRPTPVAWLSAAVCLPSGRRRCHPGVVWPILLWAAAFARSVAAACDAVPAAPTGQAVWDALRAALPKRRWTLEYRVLTALHAPLPRRPRAAHVAVDYHRVPYYGTPDRNTTRAKTTAGTHNFHTYATACVVGGSDRYTVGLTAVADREPMAAVLARLLDQVAAAGVPVRAVLLDRAFFALAVMQLLQARRLPFVVPVVVRGRKPRPGTLATGLWAVRRRRAGRYAYTHADGGRAVRRGRFPQVVPALPDRAAAHPQVAVPGVAGGGRPGRRPRPVPAAVRDREQLPVVGGSPAPHVVRRRGGPIAVGRHRAGDPQRMGVGRRPRRPAVDAGGRPARLAARHPGGVHPLRRRAESSTIIRSPNLKVLDSVLDLEQGLRSYFTFYNEVRLHQSLGYKTPAEVYRAGRSKEPAKE